MNTYLHERISKTNYCWTWTGSVGWDGYGRAYHNRLNQLAHRAVYTEFKGKIPPKMTIDHLCRNKICVNPEHLEVVSQRENILRGDTRAGKNAKKSHCSRGHEFTPENTYTYTGSRGGTWRACRACERIKHAKRRANQ